MSINEQMLTDLLGSSLLNEEEKKFLKFRFVKNFPLQKVCEKLNISKKKAVKIEEKILRQFIK